MDYVRQAVVTAAVEQIDVSPVRDGSASLNTAFALANILAGRIPNVEIEPTDSLNEILEGLTSLGFAIEEVASNEDLRRALVGEEVDLLQATFSIAVENISGQATVDGNVLVELAGLLGVEIDGLANLQGEFDFQITVGLDTQGFYLIAGDLLTGNVFSVAGAVVTGELSGSLEGSTEVIAEIEFGVDADGRAFIREGGHVTGHVELGGRISGTVQVVGLVEGTLTAAAEANGLLRLLLDDGDSLPEERFYFDSVDLDFLFTGESEWNVEGNLALEAVELEATINGLEAILPSLRLSGIGGWDWETATGHLNLDDDGLVDALAESLASNINSLADQAEMLTDDVASVPFIGEQTVIPVLEKNILDMLDVPRAVQYMIVPEAFRDQSGG